MYVMMGLLFGSLVVGFAAPLSHRKQTSLALVAAIVGTLIYYFSQRAM